MTLEQERERKERADARLTARQRQAIAACEGLRASGWTFDWHDLLHDEGWWMLPKSDDPVKRMRRGDPKPRLEGALATLELYC